MNPTEEQIVVTMKRWWKSFTVWANGVITLAMGADWIAAQAGIPSLQAYLPPKFYGLLVASVAVMNILVRVFKTKGPVQ